ncbi:hypothetical protein ACWGKS_27040 [Nocardiopsis sp. NPDC055879]
MAWEDNYRDHELWSSVADALEAVSKVPADDLTDDLIHLRALLTEISGHADQPHAALATEHLTQVKKTVATINAALPDSPAKIFSLQPNRAAPSPFVQLAQYMRTWPATGTTRLSGLGLRAEEVEAAFKALNERLDERLSEVETQSSEQSETIAAALNEHKAALTEQRTQFTALVEEKTAELQDELTRLQEAARDAASIIEQQKTRLDSALSSHQEKFSSAQDERTEKWSDLLAANETKLQEHLASMRGHEEQSRNVLSAVGVNATATDYGAYANAQSEAANRWRIGAVIALSIAATAFLLVAGAPLFGVGGDSEWWEVVLQKLSAPVGAAAVGYVLIRESGQHRKEERSARQVQLTLTALEPFIVNLPEPQKERIRVETARRIFAEQRNESPTIVTSASEDEAEVKK